jgi:hypothetical protein
MFKPIDSQGYTIENSAVSGIGGILIHPYDSELLFSQG